MRRFIVFIMLIACTLFLCSCKQLQAQIAEFGRGNTFGGELSGTTRIIFTNYKENSAKFTVSDSKVIKQIVDIMGKSTPSNSEPGVQPDYSIKLYTQNGRQISFDYWMGASDNGKETNLKDEKGSYYKAPDNLDTYIINSIKMFDRPEKFVELYSACINNSVSQLKKGDDIVTVGLDMGSDRRMQKYEISYEAERLFNNINVDGFDIKRYEKEKKYKYVVSYVTDMYNPQKAQITVEVIDTETSMKQTLTYQPKLINGIWQINRVK